MTLSKKKFYYKGWKEERKGSGNFVVTKDWNCRLKSHRCIEYTKSGGQCNRRTVIGTNICWQHLMADNNLKIKESRYGLGLFAWKKDTKEVLRQGRHREILFKPGQLIMNYGGTERSQRDMDQKYGDNVKPYAIREKNDLYLDAACDRTIAALANHGTNRQANARFTNGTIRIRARKNIKEGDEIIVNYNFSTRFDKDNQGRTSSTQEGTRYKMRHYTK